MNGIVNSDSNVLDSINTKIHSALLSADVKYNATQYSVVIQNPISGLYALLLSDRPESWNEHITNSLTQSELDMIQELNSDWFPTD